MSDESHSPKYSPVDKPEPSVHPRRGVGLRGRHKTSPETPFSRLKDLASDGEEETDAPDSKK